jgi:hypothetical protein
MAHFFNSMMMATGAATQPGAPVVSIYLNHEKVRWAAAGQLVAAGGSWGSCVGSCRAARGWHSGAAAGCGPRWRRC